MNSVNYYLDENSDFAFPIYTEEELREEQQRTEYIDKVLNDFKLDGQDTCKSFRSLLSFTVETFSTELNDYVFRYDKNIIAFFLLASSDQDVKVFYGLKKVVFNDYIEELDPDGKTISQCGFWLTLNDILIDFDIEKDMEEKHGVNEYRFLPVWTKGHSAIGGNIIYESKRQLTSQEYVSEVSKNFSDFPYDFWELENISFYCLINEDFIPIPLARFFGEDLPSLEDCEKSKWLRSIL